MPSRPSDARERLQRAALELFTQRGFDRTTAADIAAEAGVTERTFFRYFTDKREVLFTPQDEFDALFLAGLPTETSSDPRALIEAAVLSAAIAFPRERLAWARGRHRVLQQGPLQERELLKLATVARTLTEAFVERGIDRPLARVAAETAATTFRVAFDDWVADDGGRTLQDVLLGTLSAVDRLVAAQPALRS